MSEQDYELLSAYLDNMLTDRERSALEARLQSDSSLQRELTALRQTVSLIQQLPVLKAPRDFVLTPELVGALPPDGKTRVVRARIVPLPLLSFLSAAAAMALMVLGLLLITQDSAPVNTEPSQGVALQSTQAAPTLTQSFTATLEPSPQPEPTQSEAARDGAIPPVEVRQGHDAPPTAGDTTQLFSAVPESDLLDAAGDAAAANEVAEEESVAADEFSASQEAESLPPVAGIGAPETTTLDITANQADSQVVLPGMGGGGGPELPDKTATAQFQRELLQMTQAAPMDTGTFSASAPQAQATGLPPATSPGSITTAEAAPTQIAQASTVTPSLAEEVAQGELAAEVDNGQTLLGGVLIAVGVILLVVALFTFVRRR